MKKQLATTLSVASVELVNPSQFEKDLDALVASVVKGEFAMYIRVAYECTQQPEDIVKGIFERICNDNGVIPSTASRYFSDVKRLAVLASVHVTMQSFETELKELGIKNMNTAMQWISRDSSFRKAIRDIKACNRAPLIERTKSLTSVEDVKTLLADIRKQSEIEMESAKVTPTPQGKARVEASQLSAIIGLLPNMSDEQVLQLLGAVTDENVKR